MSENTQVDLICASIRKLRLGIKLSNALSEYNGINIINGEAVNCSVAVMVNEKKKEVRILTFFVII